MKELKIYKVDAFADELFTGNPAAICITENWLEDDLMQSIAEENNLSETAFLIPNERGYSIRWFAPIVEVDLCGHATLASAFILYKYYDQEGTIEFNSPRSGLLKAHQEEELIFLDFPTDKIEPSEDIDLIEQCIDTRPLEVLKGKTDYIAVLDSEDKVSDLNPNISKIAKLDARGLIVTSPGNDVDFVSRFFAPQCGVDEDPVTGSAHTSLTPLWSDRLKKKTMMAKQLSKRGGTIHCEYLDERCKIGGSAMLYLQGYINIP